MNEHEGVSNGGASATLDALAGAQLTMANEVHRIGQSEWNAEQGSGFAYAIAEFLRHIIH